ncbi:MAG TPA: YlxR family protein [Actinomycetes bacterium]
MSAPVRTCVGCRERADASELLRVVARSGALVPDVGRRMPGRGAHLHRDRGCLELATRRRAFPRALRVPGPLDDTAIREALGV